MSSYFDSMAREVRVIAGWGTDEVFLPALREIEERLYRDVTAVTGDREFPEDLREQMLGVLATEAVYQPGDLPSPERAVEAATASRCSRAADDLHDLFHELARRRIETRFGILGDSPTHIALLRDDHDGG